MRKVNQVSSLARWEELPVTRYLGTLVDNNAAIVLPLQTERAACYLVLLLVFANTARAVRRIDQSLKVTNATLVKVPFDIEHWTRGRCRTVSERPSPARIRMILPNGYSMGTRCGSVVWNDRSSNVRITVDRSAPTRPYCRWRLPALLGYCWPAEKDTDMELADEQREWARRCEAAGPAWRTRTASCAFHR